MKERLLILLSLPIACLAFSCNKRPQVKTKVLEVTMPAFGNVNFEITHDQFVSAGFNYNDLVEVTFHDYDGTNKDISYEVAYVTNYNEVGYYCPCLCNYEGKGERFDFAFGMSHLKNGSDFLIGRDVTITMIKKGGYAKTRDLVNVSRKLSYEELSGDNEAFANFRDIAKVGEISKTILPKRLYRGSSPYNAHSNPDGRHDVCDRFLVDSNINTEIALTGSKSEIESQINSRYLEYNKSKTVELYWNSLQKEKLEDKQFYSEDLGTDYFTINGNSDVVIGGGDLTRNIFTYIAKRCGGPDNPAPIFIHCNEGKDRTGFFVMVIEALAGISLTDIVNDFMLTFKNYYNVSRPDNREKYDALANLSVYRHVYSILIDNPAEELEKINWYEFDAKSEVERIISEGQSSILKDSAYHYLTDVIHVSEDDVRTIHDWISIAN